MSLRVKAQHFGSALSRMVIPNLGAFLAWGILTAVGVAIGNEMIKSFISPMLVYMLPILIAVAAGKMVYDYRGSVVGVVATMGVIIGSGIPMFLGAMIMAPIAAYILKKFDEKVEGKIPMGFELLINNFTAGVIGSVIAIIGYVAVAPAIESLTGVMAGAVDVMVENRLLPLTAIFIEPAKILFLNNAIGQGILTPIGSTQLASAGKSILFLLESNPGPGFGVLAAYMLFGKGGSKGSAYGASVIHLFGGIHEIYFPFILMNPILVLPLILGGMTGTLLFTIFNVGLIGVASPGSILAISMMAAPGDRLQIIISIMAAAAVSFAFAAPLVKRAKNNDQQLQDAAKEMERLKGKKSRVSSVFEVRSDTFDFSKVTRIAYACDAGLGSSAMGANVLQKKITKAGIETIKVFHISVSDLPTDCQVIVTHQSLVERVREKQPDAYLISITDYLKAPEYDQLIDSLQVAENQ
ncbi:PTS mannitol transporter subunit IICB [Anoxybacterium hadale]|uniref:PTS mannitol transporter subunit IICB n=2 Tax=Anoxybacterium hadale TaxID=3408580 RepID=A0ACD1AI72_9FIRM|nr:PTS mannitol transporter subunit IICB [Clostridiales bacterium]